MSPWPTYFDSAITLKPDLDPFLCQNMCSFSKNDKNHYKTCQAIYQEIQRNENNKLMLYHDSFYWAISGGGGG